MLKELKLHNGLLINTDDISTISRQDAPQPPLTVTGLVIDEYRYKLLQESLIEHRPAISGNCDPSWFKEVEMLHKNLDSYKQWKKDMEGVAPDDLQHKYVVLMKNKDTYYITKKEYDSFRHEQPHSPMDIMYDKFKESLGLEFDKELRITNSEVIHKDGNSVQLKLTCEF